MSSHIAYLDINHINKYEDCELGQTTGLIANQIFTKLNIHPYKLTNKSCIHGSVMYKEDEIIKDSETFSYDECSKGGLYGTTNLDYWAWLTVLGKKMYYCFDIVFPDNAIVYFETNGKFKSDQMILTNRRMIRGMKEWNNQDFVNDALRKNYLNSIYIPHPSIQEQLELAEAELYNDYVDVLNQSSVIVQTAAIMKNVELLEHLISVEYERICWLALTLNINAYFHIRKPSNAMSIMFFEHYHEKDVEDTKIFDYLKKNNIVLDEATVKTILINYDDSYVNVFLKFWELGLIPNETIVNEYVGKFPRTITEIMSKRNIESFLKPWVHPTMFINWLKIALNHTSNIICDFCRDGLNNISMHEVYDLIRYLAVKGKVNVLCDGLKGLISLELWEELLTLCPEAFKEHNFIMLNRYMNIDQFLDLLSKFPSVVVRFNYYIAECSEFKNHIKKHVTKLLSCNIFYYFIVNRYICLEDIDMDLLISKVLALNSQDFIRWGSQITDYSPFNPYENVLFRKAMLNRNPNLLREIFIAEIATFEDWKAAVMKDVTLFPLALEQMTHYPIETSELEKMVITQNPASIQHIKQPNEELQLLAIEHIQHIQNPTCYVQIKAYQNNKEYRKQITPRSKRKFDEMIDDIVENQE